MNRGIARLVKVERRSTRREMAAERNAPEVAAACLSVQLEARLQASLLQYAKETKPLEACGLLIGTRYRNMIRIDEVVPCENLDARRDRFRIDPGAIVLAEQRATSTKRELVGIWHSHPESAAVPSARDAQDAWSGWLYLVSSLVAPGASAARAWAYSGDGFAECELRSFGELDA